MPAARLRDAVTDEVSSSPRNCCGTLSISSVSLILSLCGKYSVSDISWGSLCMSQTGRASPAPGILYRQTEPFPGRWKGRFLSCLLVVRRPLRQTSDAREGLREEVIFPIVLYCKIHFDYEQMMINCRGN